MTDKTTTAPADDETTARTGLDKARATVADWTARLDAARAALDAAQQTATDALLDHPEDVEAIVKARADARERVRVCEDVLDGAKAAEQDAARALALTLVPALHARYAKQAKDTQAKLDAFKARTAELIGELVKHTGDERWTWALPTQSTAEPQAELERALVYTQRAARIVDTFGAGNGPALVAAIRERDAAGIMGAGNLVSTRPARQELVEAILRGDMEAAETIRADIARNGDAASAWTGYPRAEFVTLDDIPAELR